MMAWKWKKKIASRFFLYFWMSMTLKPISSKLPTLLIDSSRPYKMTVRKWKITGGSKELFLPENDFQTSSTVTFSKNIYILEAWKPTEDMKFRLYITFYICTQYDIKILLGT